jgi:hypothetical protein
MNWSASTKECKHCVNNLQAIDSLKKVKSIIDLSPSAPETNYQIYLIIKETLKIIDK